MYFGEAILQDAKTLYPDSTVIYEFNLQGTINNIKKSIKKAILSFLDKLDKFLDKCKDSKIKSWCKGLIVKVRKLLTKTDNIKDQKDAKEVQDELNKCSEEFEEKKEEYEKFEYDKFEYDKFEYDKFGENKDKKEDKSEASESEKEKSKDYIYNGQNLHKTYESIKKLLSVTPYVKQLNNLIPEDNEEKFIENIKDWDSCESFYSFTKHQVIEGNGTQFQIIQLKEATYRFITTHLKITPTNKNHYNIYGYTVHGFIGDKFDSDTMIIAGTKTDGIVKKVLLFGIRDLDKDEIASKYKMLVKVE